MIFYTFVPELLAELNQQYPSVSQFTQLLAQQAKDAIAAEINHYTYSDFLNNRVSIIQETSFLISQIFLQQFFVKLKVLLMTDVSLESTLEETLISNFVLQQSQFSAQLNDTINKIQADINLLTAKSENQIASNVQTAAIQGASQQGSYLLKAEQLRINLTADSFTRLRNLYSNDSAYISCLQMMNLFLNDDSTVIWNSDFVN